MYSCHAKRSTRSLSREKEVVFDSLSSIARAGASKAMGSRASAFGGVSRRWPWRCAGTRPAGLGHIWTRRRRSRIAEEEEEREEREGNAPRKCTYYARRLSQLGREGFIGKAHTNPGKTHTRTQGGQFEGKAGGVLTNKTASLHTNYRKTKGLHQRQATSLSCVSRRTKKTAPPFNESASVLDNTHIDPSSKLLIRYKMMTDVIAQVGGAGGIEYFVVRDVVYMMAICGRWPFLVTAADMTSAGAVHTRAHCTQ